MKSTLHSYSCLVSPRSKLNTSSGRTLNVIERLRKERELRRQSAEDFKRKRADDIKRNETSGKPGDVDFQRMIEDYRYELDPPLKHSQVGSLKINVVVRKRPISKNEVQRKDYDVITCNNPVVHVIHLRHSVTM